MYTSIIKEKINSVRDTPYSMLIYIATIFAFNIFLVLIGLELCLLSVILSVLAILIPLKFYKEPKLKKVVVAGAISIILIAAVGTIFHIHILYSQDLTVLESDNLLNGTVDKIYGDTETLFNFTVEIRNESNYNYTVYVNITFFGDDGSSQEIYNEMRPLNNGSYQWETRLDEKQYYHHFTLEATRGNETLWESTESTFGPLLIPKGTATLNIFIMRLVSPIITFLIFASLVWWKKGLDKSKSSSVKGLEEKERALEDSCPECGALLKGKDECPDCDWNKKEENIPVQQKGRVKCPDCRHLIVSDNDSCPYCGAEIEG